jgi:hypothetical protein
MALYTSIHLDVTLQLVLSCQRGLVPFADALKMSFRYFIPPGIRFFLNAKKVHFIAVRFCLASVKVTSIDLYGRIFVPLRFAGTNT